MDKPLFFRQITRGTFGLLLLATSKGRSRPRPDAEVARRRWSAFEVQSRHLAVAERLALAVGAPRLDNLTLRLPVQPHERQVNT